MLFVCQASAGNLNNNDYGIEVKLAKSNILLVAMVKVFPGYSTVKKYKKEIFNLGSRDFSRLRISEFTQNF